MLGNMRITGIILAILSLVGIGFIVILQKAKIDAENSRMIGYTTIRSCTASITGIEIENGEVIIKCDVEVIRDELYDNLRSPSVVRSKVICLVDWSLNRFGVR